eukprot:5263632-Amphidinium_carterae.1
MQFLQAHVLHVLGVAVLHSGQYRCRMGSNQCGFKRSLGMANSITLDDLTVTVEDIANDEEQCSYILESQGCLIVPQAVPEGLCHLAATRIDDLVCTIERTMEAQDSSAAEDTSVQCFGNVYARRNRCDLKLPMLPEVQSILQALIMRLKPILSTLVSEEGRLVELSCLISDPGSDRQPLHADTPCNSSSCGPLIT